MLRNEIVVDKKEMLYGDRTGALKLGVWRFEKRKIFRDNEGEVNVEMPMNETLFLIAKGKSAVWLKPEEIRDLKNMLDAQEKLAISE